MNHHQKPHNKPNLDFLKCKQKNYSIKKIDFNFDKKKFFKYEKKL